MAASSLRGLGLLLARHLHQPHHLLREQYPVFCLRLCGHVAAGRQHVAVLADIIQVTLGGGCSLCPL